MGTGASCGYWDMQTVFSLNQIGQSKTQSCPVFKGHITRRSQQQDAQHTQDEQIISRE
jgi:hypothetical protein